MLREPLGRAGDTLADYVADAASQFADSVRDSMAVVEAIDALTSGERAVGRALEHLTNAVVAARTSWAWPAD